MAKSESNTFDPTRNRLKKPPWLKRRLPTGSSYEKIRKLIRHSHLHTVCQEAMCPNIWECYSRRTATFMILGDQCTRNCRFCAVGHGVPGPPDPSEPMRVAEAASQMHLAYVVITSVTRDDLPDGGAQWFAETIRQIHRLRPDALIEVLIPDFQGNWDALTCVLEAGPDVLNHNIETVVELYPKVRPQAEYGRSLDLIRRVKQYGQMPAKSGLMLGLGETAQQVERTLEDLLDAGCEILTLGQYLQPSPAHLPVIRYLEPDEFDQLRDMALKMGFAEVASGPLVRSSYRAQEVFSNLEHIEF